MSGYIPYKKGTVLAPSGPSKHLHIICSDPIFNVEMGCECVLVVNISSVPKSGIYDNVCVLDAGEHGFIRHASYLVYKLSVLWRVPTLSNKVDSGEYQVECDVTDELISKVMKGFELSDHTPFKILRFIKRNELT